MKQLLLLLLLALFTSTAFSVTDPLAERIQQLPLSVGENHTTRLQPGESWVQLGLREHVGYEQLRRANPQGFGRGRDILIPGRHLVSRLKADGLVINQPDLMLYRWEDGQVAAWYPISIGMIASRWHTPLGRLQIISHVKNPVWHRPDWAGGGEVPAGRRNPLGDRWMGLNYPGYGIHGTSDSRSIGRTVSHGCIRMFPPHIHELFENAAVGMPVDISYETVMVGQQHGIVYLAVFPDIYARGTNQLAQARIRLASLGVEQVLTEVELTRMLQHADGVARPILGSDIAVTLDDKRVTLPLGPTVRGTTTYLPLRALADMLGAETRWEQATQTATLVRGDMTVSFVLPKGEGFSALGAVFVPVRTAVVGVGGAVTFTPGVVAITSY